MVPVWGLSLGPGRMKPSRAILRRIRLLVVDGDGVLTDGGLWFDRHGHEMKRFDSRDGRGIERLLAAGIAVAVISRGPSAIIRHRAQTLRCLVRVGIQDKLSAIRHLAARLPLSAVAFLGDDDFDLPALRAVGVGIAPCDALPAVCQAARWVTAASGGRGAVREVAEALLAARLQ